MDGPNHFRPASPESYMTNTFDNVTAHIDDLTDALANFSRVPSPEPQSSLSCCCGNDDCPNLKSWNELKTKLESRLVLSAEIGQALLQRHETYVRRSEERYKRTSVFSLTSVDQIRDPDGADAIILRLTEEKEALEKKLNQALVNNEVTEVSNRTILQELQDAQTTISRLSAHHARSVGWDSKLSSALKERDDMQQERDSESHRARLAESRFAALKDRTTKLQADVRRLQTNLEEQRMHRIESSETTIKDAQARLETFQRKHVGQSAAVEQQEISQVVESLVEDNAHLKKDNAELQKLLEETREEFRVTQEELEEHRALLTPSHLSPSSRSSRVVRAHRYTNSLPSSDSSLKLDSPTSFSFRRSTSSERKTRRYLEPLTPDTERPSSPSDPPSRLPPSPLSVTIEPPPLSSQDTGLVEEHHPQHRSLLLLSRSKAVQTDALPELSLLSPSPSPQPISSPQDHRSESSSFSSEISGNTGHMSLLIDRVVALSTRMSADVGHISRSTVSAIVAEINALRNNFRPFLEDEKAVLPCTRKDLRLLMRLLKDVFTDMGELRMTLNDIILDPSIAPQISEMALDPDHARKRAEGNTGIGGWIAPISKLFSSATPASTTPSPAPPASGSAAATALSRTRSLGGAPGRMAKVVPKIGAATSASTMTVNVEFSGAGPGRAVMSTTSANSQQPPSRGAPSRQDTGTTQSSVLSIFAGAPGRISPTPDPWVVLPQPHSAGLSTPSRQPNTPSFRRATMKPGAQTSHRMSRHLDAVIDFDVNVPIIPKTLRRRGLSDSSMHSTFTSHAEELSQPQPTSAAHQEAWPVFQAISKRVQNLRSTSTSRDSTPRKPSIAPQVIRQPTRSTSPPDSTSTMLSSAWQPPIDSLTGESREPGFMAGTMSPSHDDPFSPLSRHGRPMGGNF
ncbi:hypothetical protein DL96DRAFT_1574366 [Flagelloscypha sp. PMI_526]|nr:hypothetical protein DL96DRAFT_1574366 [Flagelloscypha sp. PMI_526]